MPATKVTGPPIILIRVAPASREEDRGVADGVRLMLDDRARHGSAVRGQRGDEPDQLEGDARGALRRHRLRSLSGFTRSVGAGGGGVARHVAEPGMPEQVVPVGMGGEPGNRAAVGTPTVGPNHDRHPVCHTSRPLGHPAQSRPPAHGPSDARSCR